MDQIIAYLGGALLIVTVIVSGCALLLRKIDAKRLVAFATIGFFSGTILLLSERITNIRLPILGEIVAKAREDAMEIKQVREEVEGQRKLVNGVVEQAKNLQIDVEQLTLSLHSQRRNIRKEYLQEKINEIRDEIRKKQGELLNTQKPELGFQISKLQQLEYNYTKELDILKKE